MRNEGQPFTENDPTYGKVYHTGRADDVQKMMEAEGAMISIFASRGDAA